MPRLWASDVLQEAGPYIRKHRLLGDPRRADRAFRLFLPSSRRSVVEVEPRTPPRISPLVLQNFQPGVPIADVHQSIRRHINIRRLRGQCDVRARVDETFWYWWHPVGDLFGRESVADIEDSNAGI